MNDSIKVEEFGGFIGARKVSRNVKKETSLLDELLDVCSSTPEKKKNFFDSFSVSLKTGKAVLPARDILQWFAFLPLFVVNPDCFKTRFLQTSLLIVKTSKFYDKPKNKKASKPKNLKKKLIFQKILKKNSVFMHVLSESSDQKVSLLAQEILEILGDNFCPVEKKLMKKSKNDFKYQKLFLGSIQKNFILIDKALRIVQESKFALQNSIKSFNCYSISVIPDKKLQRKTVISSKELMLRCLSSKLSGELFNHLGDEITFLGEEHFFDAIEADEIVIRRATLNVLEKIPRIPESYGYLLKHRSRFFQTVTQSFKTESDSSCRVFLWRFATLFLGRLKTPSDKSANLNLLPTTVLENLRNKSFVDCKIVFPLLPCIFKQILRLFPTHIKTKPIERERNGSENFENDSQSDFPNLFFEAFCALEEGFEQIGNLPNKLEEFVSSYLSCVYVVFDFFVRGGDNVMGNSKKAAFFAKKLLFEDRITKSSPQRLARLFFKLFVKKAFILLSGAKEGPSEIEIPKTTKDENKRIAEAQKVCELFSSCTLKEFSPCKSENQLLFVGESLLMIFKELYEDGSCSPNESMKKMIRNSFFALETHLFNSSKSPDFSASIALAGSLSKTLPEKLLSKIEPSALAKKLVSCAEKDDFVSFGATCGFARDFFNSEKRSELFSLFFGENKLSLCPSTVRENSSDTELKTFSAFLRGVFSTKDSFGDVITEGLVSKVKGIFSGGKESGIDTASAFVATLLQYPRLKETVLDMINRVLEFRYENLTETATCIAMSSLISAEELARFSLKPRVLENILSLTVCSSSATRHRAVALLRTFLEDENSTRFEAVLNAVGQKALSVREGMLCGENNGEIILFFESLSSFPKLHHFYDECFFPSEWTLHRVLNNSGKHQKEKNEAIYPGGNRHVLNEKKTRNYVVNVKKVLKALKYSDKGTENRKSGSEKILEIFRKSDRFKKIRRSENCAEDDKKYEFPNIFSSMVLSLLLTFEDLFNSFFSNSRNLANQTKAEKTKGKNKVRAQISEKNLEGSICELTEAISAAVGEIFLGSESEINNENAQKNLKHVFKIVKLFENTESGELLPSAQASAQVFIECLRTAIEALGSKSLKAEEIVEKFVKKVIKSPGSPQKPAECDKRPERSRETRDLCALLNRMRVLISEDLSAVFASLVDTTVAEADSVFEFDSISRKLLVLTLFAQNRPQIVGKNGEMPFVGSGETLGPGALEAMWIWLKDNPFGVNRNVLAFVERADSPREGRNEDFGQKDSEESRFGEERAAFSLFGHLLARLATQNVYSVRCETRRAACLAVLARWVEALNTLYRHYAATDETAYGAVVFFDAKFLELCGDWVVEHLNQLEATLGDATEAGGERIGSEAFIAFCSCVRIALGMRNMRVANFARRYPQLLDRLFTLSLHPSLRLAARCHVGGLTPSISVLHQKVSGELLVRRSIFEGHFVRRYTALTSDAFVAATLPGKAFLAQRDRLLEAYDCFARACYELLEGGGKVFDSSPVGQKGTGEKKDSISLVSGGLGEAAERLAEILGEGLLETQGSPGGCVEGLLTWRVLVGVYSALKDEMKKYRLLGLIESVFEQQFFGLCDFLVGRLHVLPSSSLQRLVASLGGLEAIEGIEITDFFKKPSGRAIDGSNFKSLLDELSVELFYKGLRKLPALMRRWFEYCPREKGKRVASLTRRWFSDHLVALEMSQKTKIDKIKMTKIKAQRVLNARYSHNDVELVLSLTFPEVYPLKKVDFTLSSAIKLKKTSLQWLLKVLKTLNSINGSVGKAISVWKENVEKYFNGVEECPICYSIVHPCGSLPRFACRTCRAKFHADCIYRWFAKHTTQSCPMYRSESGFRFKRTA